MMGALLFFWIFPITALASLLSYKEIKKTMPWLGRFIDSNERIRAIVQNSLPSVAMITLNALLPFMLEGKCRYFVGGKAVLTTNTAMTYIQGYRARSWIEYSLLKKCVNFMRLTTNEVSNLPPSQILPVPLCKRHFHFLAREYLLATGPRPRQFASENSREIGRGAATGIGTVCTLWRQRTLVGLTPTATGISSFPTSSYKGLALCPFNYSTSESSFPVRLCGCSSLAHLEVR